MMPTDAHVAEQARWLDEGRSFTDLSHLRKVLVGGAHAARWLNDLVTAGVEDLAAWEARRSLLLTPTGRIRADFHVVRTPQGFLLLQDPSQPHPVDEILEPYVLSSEVTLEDRTQELAVLAVLGEAGGGPGDVFRPSPLEEGHGVTAPAERRAEIAELLRAAGLREAGAEAVETWRIRRGVARFPVDIGEESLPAEAGLERLVDFTKGCFLGQESVAKVRNLGHPPRAVIRLRAASPLAVGQQVVASGREVGRVTSALPDGSGALAGVRWEDRDAVLATTAGEPLRRE